MNFEQLKNLVNAGVRLTYEQLLRDLLAPAHMRGTWSQRWLGTLGAFVDIIYEGAQQAADVGFPATAPGDALDAVGANENIERLIGEPNGTYRDRLRNPFATWKASGRASGIEAQIADFGLTNCAAYDIAAGWDPGDTSGWLYPFMDRSWERFWIVIDPPHPWTAMVLSEDIVLSDDIVLGVDGMTQADYRNLRRLILKWRSGHSSPVSIYLLFSGTLASLSSAAADALVTAGSAVELPITRPWLSDDLLLDSTLTLGYFIEPI